MLDLRLALSGGLSLFLFMIVIWDLARGRSGATWGMSGISVTLGSNPLGYLSLVAFKAAVAVYFALITWHLAGSGPDPNAFVRPWLGEPPPV